MPGHGGALGSQFRRLLAATAISAVGDGVRIGALPLLAAALTRDPEAVGGVVAAQGLPWLLFGLAAGGLADRWDRRRALVLVSAGRAVIMGTLALAVVEGTLELWLLDLLAFMLGTAETLAYSASQALLPAVVRRDAIERANTHLFVWQTTATQFVGPPLGSALFAASRAVPFLLDGLSFGAAGVLLAQVRPAPGDRTVERDRGLLREVVHTLRWLLGQRLQRALILLLVVENLMTGAFEAVLVLLGLEVLHLQQARFGLLLSAYAVGALAGSLLASRVRRALREGPAVIASVVAAGAPFVLMGAVPRAPVVGALLAVVGVGEGIWKVLVVSLWQTVIPERMLGRAFSAFRLFGWGSGALGALLGGLLAGVVGLRMLPVVAGVVILLTVPLVASSVSTDAIRAGRAAVAPAHGSDD